MRRRRAAPFRVPVVTGIAGAAASDHVTPSSLKPKAVPGTPDYKPQVAEPVMAAIDRMPTAYRALVHEFDYVNIWHAWRSGWSPSRIRGAARDGVFHLPGL